MAAAVQLYRRHAELQAEQLAVAEQIAGLRLTRAERERARELAAAPLEVVEDPFAGLPR